MKTQTFQTFDIYLITYLSLLGISPEFKLINSSRVIFEVPVSDNFYQLMSQFNSNVNVPVGDFVTELKKMRGKMLSMRGPQR